MAIGYEHTTLEMVAKSAGVSTATVYKHFPTKRALFSSIMEHIWETGIDLSNSIKQGTDSVAILTAIDHEYAQLLRQPQVEELFRVIIAEAPRFPELGEELYYRGKEPYLKRLHLLPSPSPSSSWVMSSLNTCEKLSCECATDNTF